MKDKGLYIPPEILGNDELTDKECMILAIYRYYTVEGSLHCCTLKNEDVCSMARMKDIRRFRRIKKHLKDLGYIKTDGGIRVTYIGNIDDKC